MSLRDVIKKATAKAKRESLSKRFQLAWISLNGPRLTQEHRFHPTRLWRFDFALVEKKLAVELEGGIWTGGGHTRGKKFNMDAEKYNTAGILGWRVFRLTTDMITREHLLPIIQCMKGAA